MTVFYLRCFFVCRNERRKDDTFELRTQNWPPPSQSHCDHIIFFSTKTVRPFPKKVIYGFQDSLTGVLGDSGSRCWFGVVSVLNGSFWITLHFIISLKPEVQIQSKENNSKHRLHPLTTALFQIKLWLAFGQKDCHVNRSRTQTAVYGCPKKHAHTLPG